MERLDDAVGGGRHSLGTYVGAAAFVAGLALVGIGALSVLVDALAGPAASGLGTGIALGAAGVAVTALLSVAIVVLGERPVGHRVQAGLAGSALGILLVVPAWTATPGLVGTAGVVIAGLVYLAGSLALTGVVFEGAIATDVPTASQPSYVSDSRAAGPSPGVADGGNDDDDLEFLLDEDDRD